MTLFCFHPIDLSVGNDFHVISDAADADGRSAVFN